MLLSCCSHHGTCLQSPLHCMHPCSSVRRCHPEVIFGAPFDQDISNLRAAIGGGNDAGITSPPANGQL